MYIRSQAFWRVTRVCLSPNVCFLADWAWLDERQTMVEAIDEDDWPDLLQRARQYEVTPLDEE